MSDLIKEKPMRTYIHGICTTHAGVMFITGLVIHRDHESGRCRFQILGVSNPEFQWQIGQTFEYALQSWDFYTM